MLQSFIRATLAGTSLLAAVGIALASSPTSDALTTRSVDQYGRVTECSVVKSNVPVTGEAGKITVTVSDVEANDGVSQIIAYDQETRRSVLASRVGTTNVFELKGTSGIVLGHTYDVFVNAKKHPEKTNSKVQDLVILMYRGVVAQADTKLNSSLNDATHRTALNFRDPKGGAFNVFATATGLNNVENTTYSLTFMDNGNKPFNVLRLMTGNYAPTHAAIRTNFTESPYTFVRNDQIGWSDGVLHLIYAVDLSKDAMTVGGEGWNSTTAHFQGTPVSDAYMDFYKVGTYGKGQFAALNFILNHGTWREWGQTFNTQMQQTVPYDKVYLWMPDNGGAFQNLPAAAGPMMANAQSWMTSLPLVPGDNGSLVTTGVNVANGATEFALMLSQEDNVFPQGNPRYSGLRLDDVTMANAVPVMVMVPAWAGFAPTYVGRYGENINLDAFDIKELPDADKFRAALGRDYRHVSVSRTDSLGQDTIIWCDTTMYAQYSVSWADSCSYKGQFVNENVSIDGKIPGRNVTEFAYDGTKGDKMPPTLTSLSVRDACDVINDRFTTLEGAFVEFTAMQPVHGTHPDFGHAYVECKPLQGVTVECAPNGSTEFAPLTAAEMPDLYHMPGYGYCYRAGLADVTSKSDNGWYDLRVTVTNPNGGFQRQTISPAFCVGEKGGIGDITADNAAADGPAVYYDLNGRRVAADALGTGVYIRQQGAKTEKVTVK